MTTSPPTQDVVTRVPPVPPRRDALRLDARLGAWLGVVVVTAASRLATAIGYIEDPDSLRFALSVADTYSIAALQPHVPGYPVFWAVADPLHLATGSLAVSFALVGVIATVGLVAAGLLVLRAPLASVRGAMWAGAVLVCPLVWLMATRYMPDLLGLAVALGTCAAALRAMESGRPRDAALAGALAGLLAGLRLSYVPFVVLPLLGVLLGYRVHNAGYDARYGSSRTSRRRVAVTLVVTGFLAVTAWLVPLILDTGWADLLAATERQTTGHFTDFGGTIQTEEAHLGARIEWTVRSVWADGLGGWVPGRHPLTALAGLALVLGVLAGTREAAWLVRLRAKARRTATWLLASAAMYAVWIVLFQNVIHKSRHAMPLIALALLVLALGAARVWDTGGRWRGAARSAVIAGFGAVTVVASTLAVQHRQPSAIAQVTAHVREITEADPDVRIVTTPLVWYTLEQQGIRAPFVDATAPDALTRAPEADALAIGARISGREAARADTFYHNPYVNRMWAAIPVYRYAP
ncbi:MAG: hypothetical protein AAF791_00985 [Bacteroidota bacterium]